MVRIRTDDIFITDDDKIIFGDDLDAEILWDNSMEDLRLTSTISGVDPTQPYHLTTRWYVDTSVSGVEGTTGFGLWAYARVDADGTVRDSYNLSVSRSAAGTYDCSFVVNTQDNYYGVIAQPYQTVTDTNAMISNVSTTGFTVKIGQGDNGATPDVLTDTDFAVVVFDSQGSPASMSGTSFLQLIDTPSSYNGYEGSYLRVTSSGIEFATVSGGGPFDYTETVKFSTGEFQLDLGSPPSYTSLGPLGALLFDPNTDESVYGSFTVPSEYKSNTNIIVNIRYMNASVQVGTNNCVWSLDYHTYSDGETYASKTITTASVTDALPNNAVAGTFQETSITMTYNDVNNPITAGDTVAFRFYRDANNANDTMTGDAALFVVAFDIETEVGS